MSLDHAQISHWQSKLLPQMVDCLAKETPSKAYALWPIATASPEAGFRTVTYAQLANLVNGLAQLLINQLGPGNGEALTYVGPNDVRLTALVLAAIKTGYVLFLTSPRNSPAAHRALSKALNCRILVTTDPAPPSAQTIIEAIQPRQLIIPSVQELVEQTYSPVIYEKSFENGIRDALWVIHTSGSTGLPKPLVWTQGSAARQHECSSRKVSDGVVSVDYLIAGKRILVTVPPFHGAGLSQYLLWAIPFGSIPIAPAGAGIVSAQGLVNSLEQTPADVAVLVPSVVAELAQNPELLDYCASHLELILYIGGDLPQAIGDVVARRIQLRCWWGASECGIPHQLIPPGLAMSEWRYIRFHPSVGATFDPITQDTYELVIRRDDTLSQPCFSIRGHEQLKEYRTKDLFTRHPTVQDAWCWQARADDIIVFLNGEKTNPVSMEQHVVATNPELSGVLVIGSQRFQAALLVEPAPSFSAPMNTSQEAELIEKIWPSIHDANQLAPAHAHIEKAFVLITSPDRPFIRAGKGTIQRGASLAQYATEIDALYANADLGTDDEITSGHTLETRDSDAVACFVRESVHAVTGWTEADGGSASFFDQGMDSLQALQLTRVLRRRLNRPDVGLPTIYNNPTLSKLTAAILARKDEDTDKQIMEPLLKTYKELILQIPQGQQLNYAVKQTKPVDVILTGSTGTIGTFLLRALLDRPGVGHLFCLNRGDDGGRASQDTSFKAAGLRTDDLDKRVTFLKADLSSPGLGLEQATYDSLRARIGLIIHNAWPVNFNLGLPAFRPQLAGLVNLFALAAAGKADGRPHLVFVSSVGAVGGLLSQTGSAPEEMLSSMDTPYSNGYSRSKFLSEMLCEAATKHLGLPVTIARVGQVAGAVRRPGGIWNPTEWLPSLVISSLRSGCLPDDLGRQFSEVDWIPSDLLADVLVDLATQTDLGTGAQVFNLRNPNTTTWKSLIPAIADASETHLGRSIEEVSSSVWLTRLGDSEREGIEGHDHATLPNPAVKLLQFYRDGLWGHIKSRESQSTMRPMDISNAQEASLTLRSIPAVNLEWMQKWVDEWLATSSLVLT